LIEQQGYEIDSQGNVGNETKRIEDLSLRFVILVTCILTRIEDLEVKTKMTERAVKTCHKETGVPISELASLLVRMTKEVKELTEQMEKNSEDMQDFFKKIEALVSYGYSFFSFGFLFFCYGFLFFILGLLYFRYLGCNCIESPEFWSPKV